MKKLLLLLLLLPFVSLGQEQALVESGTGSLLQTRDLAKLRTQPTKAVWVPMVRNPQPVYDSATEKLVKVETFDGTTFTISWNKVALSQAELDAITARQAEAALFQTRKTNLQNIIATLEAGNATNAQVQTAIARLIKQVGLN